MLSLPIQRFLYISSATMLILSTHAARAAQPHETVAIDVSMFAVSASTSAESSPIHPKCDQAVLAESLAITAAPSVCAGDNGIQMLPPEPVATAPRPDLVAAATTPTDTPATHPNSDESPPDIVVSADPHASKIDPLKAANVQSFEAAQAADAAVLFPVSAYETELRY